MQDISTRQPVNASTITAKIISYIFHPLFIPTYVFFWLLSRLPYEFAGITPMALFARKITVFWITAFFPAFSVFLLWRLKFIQSMLLKTQQERIVPYIITMVFYWWMWYLSRSTTFSDQPIVLKPFFFSIFLATVAGLILNSFFKISMHGMAMGGLLVFVVFTSIYYQVFFGIDITVVTLLTGLVCTARLMLSEHNGFEVYTGLIVGAICQLIAIAVAL